MGNSPTSTLILIVLMALAFYLLIIRPNKKRQLAQQQTMNQLVPGSRVLLTSGIFGTITEIGDKQAVLELSPGVHLTVLKPAIARVVREGEEDTDVDDELEDELSDDDDLSPLDANPRDASPLDHTATDRRPTDHRNDLTGSGPATDGTVGGPGRTGTTSSGTTSSHALDGGQDRDGRAPRTEDPHSGTSTTPLKD